MMTKEKTIADRKEQKALTERALSREQYAISGYVSRLKFKPCFWGVEEAEVWRAMENLCQLYEDALAAERSRRERAEAALKAGEGSGNGEEATGLCS